MGTAGVQTYIAANHTFYLVSAQPPRQFARAWADGWFNGSGYTEDEAAVAHSAENSPSHRMALYASRGRWHIYDSAYNFDPVPQPLSRRLSSISGLARFVVLFDLLRGRGVTPVRVRTGGGGNDASNINVCREMSCQWIAGEILYIMGDESHRVVVGAWEELKRS